MSERKYKICAVDFDGTLCEDMFPAIGSPNVAFIKHLIKCREQGDKIILWTCRVNERLQEAVEWCKSYGLEFDAVNENLPEMIKLYGNDCRKVFADVYIDDKEIKEPTYCVPYMPTWEQRQLKPDCVLVTERKRKDLEKEFYKYLDEKYREASELLYGYGNREDLESSDFCYMVSELLRSGYYGTMISMCRERLQYRSIGTVKECMEAVKRQNDGKWILCSERLPEDCVDVLVWFEYFRYGEYNRLFQRIGISYTYDGEWSGVVNGRTGWNQLSVIAWQPLPKPYHEP